MEIKFKINNAEFWLCDRPEHCPYCHRDITPVFIQFLERISVNPICYQALFQCNLSSCSKAIIANYSEWGAASFKLQSVEFGTIKPKEFSPEIYNISPSFVEIYQQAHAAQQYNLTQICGPGYRKALEFLIKDYLIKLNPPAEQEVKAKFLKQCINDYITDPKIKEIAIRATCLGNDETHYVRIWVEKDIEHLITLIDLTVYWIISEHRTKQILIEMP